MKREWEWISQLDGMERDGTGRRLTSPSASHNSSNPPSRNATAGLLSTNTSSSSLMGSSTRSSWAQS